MGVEPATATATRRRWEQVVLKQAQMACALAAAAADASFQARDVAEFVARRLSDDGQDLDWFDSRVGRIDWRES